MPSLIKKASDFYRHGNEWFSNAALPSDITIEINGILFHLHKFPLLSKCGKIAHLLEELPNTAGEIFLAELDGCPGGDDAFLVAAKFCYGIRVELAPRNIAMVYCAADYLEMTEEYGEDNLLPKSESFFHKTILRSWKDCILALQNLDPVFEKADTLQIVGKTLNALSMMACTDPSLFGWPLKMYGTFQSPGGSILWNGISTGARIRSLESDWWFEDVSSLNIRLFERLIETMKWKGIRPGSLVGAVMHYAQKYLPGLSRWQAELGGKTLSVTSFKERPTVVNQKALLENVEKLLPAKKGKPFCSFLLGLLRVGMILGVSQSCQNSLEKRIGLQLDLATLNGLLLPNYSNSDNLYDTDCIERIIRHFLSMDPGITAFSPSSSDVLTSPSSGPLRKVGKVIDNYLAEIAPDVNLKPGKMQALADALPESSRSLDDGLYRALDIYFKAHPWLSNNEKQKLCDIINCQKLSIDACTHASQNERLPLRFVLQVLFFEQLQLKATIAGCLQGLDIESGHITATASRNEVTTQTLQRGGWITVVRENQVLRVDMENMRSRVLELEQELAIIKQEIQRVAGKLNNSFLSSPRLAPWRIGCKFIARTTNRQLDTVESTIPTPRLSLEQSPIPGQTKQRKSFSLF